MKGLLLALTLTFGFIFAGNAYAQNFDQIYKKYKKYKKEENITGIRINKLGCILASLFVDSEDGGKQFLKQSSNIRILINEKGHNNDLINDLNHYITNSKLEPLISMVDKKDHVAIYVVDKNQSIRQLLIVTSDEEEQTIIKLDGKFPLKMIKEMVNKNPSSFKAKH